MRFIERVWNGDAPGDRLVRALLTPFELAFRGAVAIRSELYDNRVLRISSSPIPVVSVGNLTVGGTGKTPVAAWIASRLIQKGRSPAMILRGYGGDETIVHKLLNPQVPVLEATDRVSGIRLAADGGADVAILDDAFQHRRAARDVDIVLVSADEWRPGQRMLPAGPYREPAEGLRRATAVMITARTATDEKVARVESFIRQFAPDAVLVTAKLEMGDLVRAGQSDERRPATSLRGKSVLAVAGIGNPRAFFSQLENAGARVTPMIFPDHHAYTASETLGIADKSGTFDYVVCTLKDAVKLSPQWPADKGTLWYVSLSVKVERGEAALDEILTQLDSSRDTRINGY